MSDELVVAEPPRVFDADRLRQSIDRPAGIDWVYAGGVAAFHVLALLAFFPWFFSWTGLALLPLGVYVFGTLGINVGFHRLLTHRSFACPRWLERTFVILGTCSVMEAPAYWVAIHRQHHQYADDERDPHSPLRSFVWAHFGWYTVKTNPVQRAEVLRRYAKDVMRDPVYAFFERLTARVPNWIVLIGLSWAAFFVFGVGAALATGSSVAAALQFGASILVWGVFVRTVLVFQITMCVNSITHLWGYRTYATDDSSRNNLFIGFLAAGEGWHNNHHADPRSARHGHAWWEFDVAWLTIRLLHRLGLAWDIALPSPHLASMKAHGR